MGAQVVNQLLSPLLAKSFKIISLSNSKYTLSLAPASPALSPSTILSLLPKSSAPALPEPSTQEGISFSLANSQDLIGRLAKLSKDTQRKIILIDCTSDLSVTELYPSAISAGISVITPNKKGFSSSAQLWHDILAAQKVAGSGLVYLEATVGAGLPIISTLKDLINTGDEVTKIEGVLSGTLSYIFNEFSKAGTPVPGEKKVKFSEVVKIAKENGYTEPHPADDLSGSDVARKLTILSRLISLSPSTTLPPLPALVEGYASLPTKTLIPEALANIATGNEFVERLPEFDAEFDTMREEAEKEGKVLRYVGVIDAVNGMVKCGLEKYPYSHPFASFAGSVNIIAFHTKRYAEAPLIIQGSGAGNGVTAMGVVADAVKVAERFGVRFHL